MSASKYQPRPGGLHPKWDAKDDTVVAEKIVKDSKWWSSCLGRQSKACVIKRVRFHLSKGRTAGDIVVRERLLASVVNAAIEEIQNEPKN